jgi:hypothetical protein
MKRLVLFAAVVALAACAKKDDAATDTSTMAAPTAMTVADSTAKADSMKADSVRKDSIAKADTTKK